MSADATPPRVWWSAEYGRLYTLSPSTPLIQEPGERYMPSDVVELRPAPAEPSRDDEVAAWIKRHRDQAGGPGIGEWESLDFLLDDYRLHADTEIPLSEAAHDGPYGDEEAGARALSGNTDTTQEADRDRTG